jgi:3-hydroxybutyryl-CoA dehydratase
MLRRNMNVVTGPSMDKINGVANAHRHGLYFEDMSVGMTATYSKTITDADIVLFTGVSGDTNPMHHDDEFAANSIFGERIAHGMLTASLLSTVFGTKLPGPGCVYISQSLRFRAPVRIGETVVARVTIEETVPEKNRVRFRCACLVADNEVIVGEAVLLVPSRPPYSVIEE